MEADEYQDHCRETAIYPKDCGVIYTLFGLGSEVGEMQGKYKKFIRDGGDWTEIRTTLGKELGDVLWYCAMLAHELEYPLSTVMERNVLKLQGRKERGTLGGSGDDR